MKEKKEMNLNGVTGTNLSLEAPKSKNMTRIILIIIAIVCTVTATILAIGPRKIYVKLYQMTHSKATYYAWLEANNTEAILDYLTSGHIKSYHYNITLSTQRIPLLQETLPEKVILEGDIIQQKKEKSYMDANINVDGQGLLDMSLRTDMEQKQLLIGKDGVYQQFSIDNGVGVINIIRKNSQKFASYIQEFIKDSGVKVTSDASEKFTVGTSTITATKLTVEFPVKKVYASLANQLQKTTSDKSLLDSYEAEGFDKDGFTTYLETVVEQLKEQQDQVPEDETMEMVCYIDSQGHILGRTFDVQFCVLQGRVSYQVDPTGKLVLVVRMGESDVVTLTAEFAEAENAEIPELKEEDITINEDEYGVIGYLDTLLTPQEDTDNKEEVSEDTSEGTGEGGFEFTLGQYKDIPVYREVAEVTEEELQSAILEFVEYDSDMLPIVNRETVAANDLVNIDFTGRIDGQEFEGGSGTDMELLIGSGQFIDGFEEQLIGVKVGDTVHVDVTFPDDYDNTELASKEAEFEVVVNAIGVREYTDEFVAYNSEWSNREEYEKALRQTLLEDKQLQSDQNMEQSILEQIIDNCKFTSINQDEIDEYRQQMIDTYNYYAMMYQVDLETFVSSNFQMTLDEFYDEVDYISDIYVKIGYVIQEIAKQEGISISDAEYDEEIQKYMEIYHCETPEELEAGYGGKEETRKALIEEKVLQFLTDHADILNE